MTAATTPRSNQRERILDAALELMSAQGSAATSMRQLADACGVRVAAIYHYFPSKDELLRSVVEERRYTSRLEAPVDIDMADPPPERLAAVFRMFWQGAIDEEPVLRLLLGEALRHQPAAMPTGAALLEVFRGGVLAVLDTSVPELPDPVLAAQLVVSTVFTGFVRHVLEPGTPVEEIGDEQLALLLATSGVAAPRTPSA